MTDTSDQRHPMSPQPRDRDGKRRKADAFFKEKDTSNKSIFRQMQTERVINDAKTAKLRALRLAKEEVDRETARIAEENKKSARPAAKSKR